MPPEVLILRHGQTEWNLAGRYQGAMDSALTTLGREQAARQGRILREFLAGLAELDCLASPQPRTLATAALAVTPLGLAVRPDHRLREIAIGEWEGLTWTEISTRHPVEEEDHFWWMDAAPGGEMHAGVAARVADLLASLTRPTVLVTHGVTSCHLRGQLLGLGFLGAAQLQGEQGVVYHIAQGREVVLRG